MIKRYFPPVRETMLVAVITVVFLLLTATCSFTAFCYLRNFIRLDAGVSQLSGESY